VTHVPSTAAASATAAGDGANAAVVTAHVGLSFLKSSCTSSHRCTAICNVVCIAAKLLLLLLVLFVCACVFAADCKGEWNVTISDPAAVGYGTAEQPYLPHVNCVYNASEFYNGSYTPAVGKVCVGRGGGCRRGGGTLP
jgi:hypothetical protein